MNWAAFAFPKMRDDELVCLLGTWNVVQRICRLHEIMVAFQMQPTWTREKCILLKNTTVRPEAADNWDVGNHELIASRSRDTWYKSIVYFFSSLSRSVHG